ncbi:MAG: hypothetical protein QM765_30095 [Myxococcales bacterium]
MRPFLQALLVASLTLACPGAPPPETAFPTGFCSKQGWCWELPLPEGAPITGLYAADRDHAWVAAGNKVLKFDGAGWAVVYEAPGRITDLRGTSPSDLWLATDAGMARWRGERWEVVSWADGTMTQVRPLGGGRAVAFDRATNPGLWHWDGQAWARDPDIKGTVPAAFGTSRDDLWTIDGHDPRLMIDPPLRGFLAHWDGAQWTTGSPSESYEVVDLWADGTEVWAAAIPMEHGYPACVLLHQVGGEWVRQHEIRETPYSCALWAGSANDLWLASGEKLAHWDGKTWTESSSPVRGKPVHLWGSAGTIWASAGARVARLDGGQWSELLSPKGLEPDKALQAIWCGASEPVAAGPGTILTRTDAGWAVSWEGPETVKAVWGPPGSDDLWAVGSDGLILARKQGEWRRQPSPTTEPLNGVWGRSAADVYAVGHGTLLHFDGVAWRALSAPYSGNLLAVWGAPTGRLMLARDDGGVVSEPSTPQGAWVAVPTRTRAATYDHVSVWTDGPSMWLAWNGGWYGHTQANRWEGQVFAAVEPTGGFSGPGAVWGRSANDVYLAGFDAAGGQGTVAHWDGASWTVEATGATSLGLGLCGAPGRGLWVVGGAPATILRRDLR